MRPESENPTPIAAVVLAAGGSTRMGTSKQLLPVAGKPLVRLVVETVCESGLAQVVVVVGAGAGSVSDALAGLPVDIVVNGHLLGQVPVDGSGEIAFTLTTDEASEGTYHLRVTVNPSGGLAFVLDESEPERPKVGDLEEIEVPEGLITHPVYLPLVLRSSP